MAFYVGGLERSILALLKNGDAVMNQPGMTGVKEYAAYTGELNREDLIQALKSLAPRFPLVLVAYGSGKDRRRAATGLDGDRIEIEHTCGFVVIVASNDLRSEAKRRTNAYQMVGEVRQLLGGIQFEIENDGADEFLNHSPFIPAGVETIARLPDLTAYAVHFETSFHEFTADRRIVSVGTAKEILFGIESVGTGIPPLSSGENDDRNDDDRNNDDGGTAENGTLPAPATFIKNIPSVPTVPGVYEKRRNK